MLWKGSQEDLNIGTFDALGIGTNNPRNCTLKVGSGQTSVCVDDSGVGIGTTANGFSLHATGPINFIGTCYASNFSGDGSQITNLNVEQTGWAPVVGGIYNSNLNNEL